MAFTLQIGEAAPSFNLPGVDGRSYSLNDFADSPVLVVVFSCNHCPFVLGAEDRIIDFHKEYAGKGVALVAINSNSAENHPGDSFEGSIQHAQEKGYTFPYLRDENQDAAWAYGALKTPHFYVFDADRKLAYTGRFDDNPKAAENATTHELKDAVDAVLAGREVDVPLTNPIGCNVKWKGQESRWTPPEACDLVLATA